MCNTGWKKVLERCGRTQRSTAQALNVNQAELSLVMQGRAFLTPEKFIKACELLGCRPTDVYALDVLEVMYGKAEEPKRKRGVRIELDEDTGEFVSMLAGEEGVAKTKLANYMLRFMMKRRDLWP